MNEKIRYASKSREEVNKAWFARHPHDPIKHKTMRWPAIAPRHVKRSVILIRFRKFIEGDIWDSGDIAFFLESYPHWWLMTSDEAEREHAKRVLSRLYDLAIRNEQNT